MDGLYTWVAPFASQVIYCGDAAFETLTAPGNPTGENAGIDPSYCLVKRDSLNWLRIIPSMLGRIIPCNHEQRFWTHFHHPTYCRLDAGTRRGWHFSSMLLLKQILYLWTSALCQYSNCDCLYLPPFLVCFSGLLWHWLGCWLSRFVGELSRNTNSLNCTAGGKLWVHVSCLARCLAWARGDGISVFIVESSAK